MDPSRTDHRRRLGAAAEAICEQRLRERGWTILDRNWRIRMGEVDLIARDGRTIVFIEVKAAAAGSVAGPERPAMAVGRNKQRRLRRLASAWLSARGHRLAWDEVRFDVVGISFDREGMVGSWEHVEGAF
jgi:putative endonuclease